MTHSSTQLIEIVISLARSSGDMARSLKKTFRENPSISQEVRRDVARAALGIRVYQRKISHLLGEPPRASSDGLPMAIAAAHFLFLIRVDGHARGDATQQSGLSEAEAAAVLAVEADVVFPTDPVEMMAIEHSLPDWMAHVFVDDMGARAATSFAQSSNQPGPICFRANRGLGRREELAATLAAEGITTTPSRVAPDGLIALGRPNIRGSAAYRRGAFEVQDEASQLVSLACGVQDGNRVWDVCAGRGGKSLALAATRDADVEVCATDVDADALKDLRVRLGRVQPKGVTARLLPQEGGAWEEAMATHKAFDVVLVDAPCSALGTLRRSPDRRWTTSPAIVDDMAQLQRRILHHASFGVRPGGALVYATCTVTKRENENVVENFLREHPEFSPSSLGPVFGPQLSRRIRLHPASNHQVTLTPHDHGTDGFFIARMARTNAGQGTA